MPNPRLSAEAIQEQLPELEGFRYEGNALRRRFEFPSFVEAFGWMSAVALVAERMNHHPDWRNVYGKVDVELSTHDAGGVSAKDFELAKAMVTMFKSR